MDQVDGDINTKSLQKVLVGSTKDAHDWVFKAEEFDQVKMVAKLLTSVNFSDHDHQFLQL